MARVLIADDEPTERQVLAHGLSRHGHDVVAVADGAEAVTALTTARYDVLVADIVMPVMDGIALALKASADHPELRICWSPATPPSLRARATSRPWSSAS